MLTIASSVSARKPCANPGDSQKPVSGRTGTQVHRDVEHAAMQAVDELALGVRELAVQAAQHAEARGQVVLVSERGRQSGGCGHRSFPYEADRATRVRARCRAD